MPVISGRVNSNEEPEIAISIFIRGRFRRKKAVIDTGFNGYLSVPASLLKGWYFSGFEHYEIATGEVIEQKVYLGRVIWNQTVQEVYSVASQARDILIGTKLLGKNKLLIDFPRKKVVIR